VVENPGFTIPSVNADITASAACATTFNIFSISVNSSKKEGDKWVDVYSFLNMQLWGKYGQSMTQHLIRGKKVMVNCTAKQDRWEKDGKKNSRILFNVDSLVLGGAPQQSSEPNSGMPE
jgi:single-strand DNA-binding protein